MNLGYLHLLLERDFLVPAFAAIASFATIITLGLPYMKSDALAKRMVAVADRREQLRLRQKEALAQNSRRGNIRGAKPMTFMKRTLEDLKLQKLLESPGLR